MSKSDDVQRIATVWCYQPTVLSAPQRLKEIATLLYHYRNDLLPPERLARIPTNAVSDDEEVMAAVEHYFYARSEVANAEYSATNMKAYIIGYQFAKRAGLDLRHNKDKPTTPPSKLQEQWALIGAAQGEQDLRRHNDARKAIGLVELKPPTFRLPPNFTGSYGGTRLDTVKY